MFFSNLKRAIAYLALVAFLSACGGSVSEDGYTVTVSDNTKSKVTSAISGAGVKGPLAFAEIELYELDLSSKDLFNPLGLITSTTANASGNFSLDIPVTASPPYVLLVRGEESTDLNTGLAPVVSTLKNIITEEMLVESNAVYATPLTTLAVKMARLELSLNTSEQDFLESLYDAAELVKANLGFGFIDEVNILTDSPIVSSDDISNTEIAKIIAYRAASESFTAAMYQMSNSSNDNQSDNVNDVIEKLALDLQSDGLVDNQESGVEIGGILPEIFDNDPSELVVPNTVTKIKELTSLLDAENTQRGMNTNFDITEVKLDRTNTTKSIIHHIKENLVIQTPEPDRLMDNIQNLVVEASEPETDQSNLVDQDGTNFLIGEEKLDDPVIVAPIKEQKPVVNEPVVVEIPVVEEPINKEPVVVEIPVIEEPTNKEPVVVEIPVVEEPTNEEPVIVEIPVVEEPTNDEPVIVEIPVVEEEPTNKEPIVVEEPATEEPVVVEEPSIQEPVIEAPEEVVPVQEELHTIEVPTNHSIIPQTDWALAYVDSEETVGSNRPATRAFDGDPSTYWITQWYESRPLPPHEIHLDLGAIYELSSLIYTPRGNGSIGRVKDYEFYISDDGENWGAALVTDSFINSAEEQSAVFEPVTGRFIRLKALNEVDGNHHTAIAEINVTGRFISEIPLTVPDNHSIIPQTDWALAYVDSEETVGSNRPATRAFDGDPSTYWITQWYESRPLPPHEIHLDLGAIYELSSLIYTPRGNGSIGRVKDYEFYISDDGENWGAALVADSFINSAEEQSKVFEPVTGRFIRLKALNEVDGNHHTAIAEINVTGRFIENVMVNNQAPETQTSNNSQESGTDDTTNNLIVSPLPETVSARVKQYREMLNNLDNNKLDWDNLVQSRQGTLYFVTSETEFNTVSAAAVPGDVIVLKNGTYNNVTLNVKNNGTEYAPIIYKAETIHGVTITGNSRFEVRGNHNIIGGFVFRDIYRKSIINLIGASDNRISENEFYDCGAHDKARIISISHGSHRNRTDHNLMDGNLSFGYAVSIPARWESHDYSMDNRFDHNVLRNITSDSIYHRVPVQIGQYAGKNKEGETRSIIDNNEFINIRANTINSKGHKEYYYKNRFVNNTSYIALSLRGGSDKYIDSNYFENTDEPMRAFGARHVITNNIMINSKTYVASFPSWGFVDNPETGARAVYVESGDIVFAHNTIVGFETYGLELGRIWGFLSCDTCEKADNPPYNVQMINNVMVSSKGTMIKFRTPLENPVISNNLFYSTGVNNLGESGVNAMFGDPKLTSTYGLQSTSIARDSGMTLNDVPLDYSGNSRDVLPDIGALEY